jgi:hypothetical protein
MEGDDLIYDITVIEGTPPKVAGATALFIDIFGVWRRNVRRHPLLVARLSRPGKAKSPALDTRTLGPRLTLPQVEGESLGRTQMDFASETFKTTQKPESPHTDKGGEGKEKLNALPLPPRRQKYTSPTCLALTKGGEGKEELQCTPPPPTQKGKNNEIQSPLAFFGDYGTGCDTRAGVVTIRLDADSLAHKRRNTNG